jgi:hypothetical protein
MRRHVDLILGTTFEQEREASGITVAMNIGSAVYRHAHL